MEEALLNSEDVIEALLDRLLDPILHELSRKHFPSSGAQIVAQQLEAAAWIFYYHLRRSNPTLEFYAPSEFCRKVVILRAGFCHYIELTNDVAKTSSDQGNTNNSLAKSRIEAAFAAASEISDSTTIKKVAVLILSHDRTQCLLIKDLITRSLWSFIEAQVPENILSIDVALSSIRENAGIDRGILQIEKDSYESRGMSQEGKFTRLYIMTCKHDVQIKPDHSKELLWVSVEDLISRASGEMITRTEWDLTATLAVDYFHIHPYLEVMRQVLSRKPDNTTINLAGKLNETENRVKPEVHTTTLPKIEEGTHSDIAFSTNNSTESMMGSRTEQKKRKSEDLILKQEKEKKMNMDVKPPVTIVVDSDDEEDKTLQNRKLHTNSDAQVEHNITQSQQRSDVSSLTKAKNIDERLKPKVLQDGLHAQIIAESQKRNVVQACSRPQISGAMQMETESLHPSQSSECQKRDINWGVKQMETESLRPAQTSDVQPSMGTGALCLSESNYMQRLQNRANHDPLSQELAKLAVRSTVLQKDVADYAARLKEIEQKESLSATKSFLDHLQDPVQVLEDFCLKNQWPKPHYEIQTTPFKTTQYMYSVTVYLCGRDFQHSERGCMNSGLQAAKQSAASMMLSRLYMLKSG